MVKQAVYGIDGMTQVVLYFWPLLFLDEATIDDEIRNLLRPDLNFLAFMHLCKESKELIPEPLEGINAYGKCFGIPKNLDVLEKFPDIVSGKLDLESFIPKTMATTGYVEPKSSKKRKITTTDEANKKAKVDIIDGEAEEDKTNAEPVKMQWYGVRNYRKLSVNQGKMNHRYFHLKLYKIPRALQWMPFIFFSRR